MSVPPMKYASITNGMCHAYEIIENKVSVKSEKNSSHKCCSWFKLCHTGVDKVPETSSDMAEKKVAWCSLHASRYSSDILLVFLLSK